MLSKEQANAAAESLLQGRKEKSRWDLRNRDTSQSATQWAQLGLLVGMSVGIFANLLFTGRSMPGMGFGMFAGALVGAYFDKRIRAWFLVSIVVALGIAGVSLWHL